MADLHANLLALSDRTMGDAFDVAASSGDTTLSLYDVSDFDEDGGEVTIGGTVYAYDSADMEADTIHLTSGLLAATAVDDRADIWDADNGVVVSERVAMVTVDDQGDGDPVAADVDHALAATLNPTTLGVGQSVTVVRDGDGYLLTRVHGKNSQSITRSSATTVQHGIDDGAGNVYGIIASVGGAVVRVGTDGDFRVKTPDGVTYMPVLASAFTISSDSTTKTPPTPAPDALAIIDAAPAMCWRYLTDDEDVKRVGPMADALPAWLALHDAEDGTLTVDLARMVGVLWTAIGQLHARVTDLENGSR